MDEIFSAYFAFGRDISSPQTLLPIAQHHGLDPEHLKTAPVPPVLPIDTPEGLRTVPCLMFDGVSVLFGAPGRQGLKNMIRLTRQIEKENLFLKK